LHEVELFYVRRWNLGSTMADRGGKDLVEAFYHVVWNRGDEAMARRILATDFFFRGSIGLEKRGPDGFIDYMRMIRGALSGYRCEIVALIAEADRAAARMRFHGNHIGSLLGFEPTGRPVEWAGAAFFRFADGQIAELWVLGDTQELRRQLAAG
jgi:steroid delta-isomerase-like uncharacterized protein